MCVTERRGERKGSKSQTERSHRGIFACYHHHRQDRLYRQSLGAIAKVYIGGVGWFSVSTTVAITSATGCPHINPGRQPSCIVTTTIPIRGKGMDIRQSSPSTSPWPHSHREAICFCHSGEIDVPMLRVRGKVNPGWITNKNDLFLRTGLSFSFLVFALF